MVFVHIGNHVDDGQKAKKRAVRFVCFGYQIFTVAKMGVGSVGVEPAADDNCGIKPCRIKNGCRKRCGGGFAVRTGNGNTLPQAHEFGQHFGAGNDGDIAAAGFHQLGIFVVDGGRLYQHLHIAHIFRSVAHGNVCPKLAKMAHYGRITHVRARNLVALIEKNLGNAAHARAANANHMNTPNLAVHAVPLKKV